VEAGRDTTLAPFPGKIDVFIIQKNFKSCAQGGNVRALGSGFSVDGLDGDPSHGLKRASQKVAQRTEIFRQAGILRGKVEG